MHIYIYIYIYSQLSSLACSLFTKFYVPLCFTSLVFHTFAPARQSYWRLNWRAQKTAQISPLDILPANALIGQSHRHTSISGIAWVDHTVSCCNLLSCQWALQSCKRKKEKKTYNPFTTFLTKLYEMKFKDKFPNNWVLKINTHTKRVL